MDSTLAIFVHLHKTAGTTLLDQVFPKQYGKSEALHLHGVYDLDECAREYNLDECASEYKSLPQRQQSCIRLITGHFAFGLHERIDRTCSYFTMLRRPLDRVHSLYFFLRDMDLGRVYLENHGISYSLLPTSVSEFAHSGLFMNVDNGQVRALSGVGDSVPYGEVSERHYPQAVEALDKHFNVVGLTERFDESLLLTAHTYQWKNVYYVRTNTNQDKPSLRSLSASDQDAIERYSHWDQKLYEYAEERLEKQLSSCDGLRSLSRFQWVNRNIYKPANLLYSTVRRAKHKLVSFL